jgi:catechol 2,3-dioxygenase-like lactoylglutathione lyase family enzyme
MLLDAVRIGTHDLAAACRTYAVLLGTPGRRVDPALHRFRLARGTVDLVAGGPAGLFALRFLAAAPPACDLHGLAVELAPTADPEEPATPVAIDHVVVQSLAPERAIATWRDALGLRLALDREFPARGLRLLFFRSNHITLEYACPLPAHTGAPGPDRLHGVSYRVPELHARRERLLEAGCDVSGIRPGMKPGTRVATVRSGTAGVPTLLLATDST